MKITDLDWAIFRMQFGNIIVNDQFGILYFCHNYFIEAIQTTIFGKFKFKYCFKMEKLLRVILSYIQKFLYLNNFFISFEILFKQFNK